MKAVKMLGWSLKLDYIFLLKIPGLSLFDRVYFILLKYILYLKNVIFGLPDAPGYVKVFQKKFYYNDVFGIATLQRIYCEHYGLKGIVNENPVIVDVGANIGQFNFFARHYLNARRVVSIEPVEDSYELLKVNAANPDDCIRAAVGNRSQVVEIHVSKTSSQHCTLVKDGAEDYSGSIRVVAKTLDDVFNDAALRDTDLLKVDVEGSEYDVLLSAERSLPRISLLTIEMSAQRPSMGDIAKVRLYLEDRSYKLINLSTGKPQHQRTVEGVFQRV